MKIFIVGPNNIDKLEYANSIIALNDNLNICRYFTSDKKFDGMIGEYIFHLDIDDIELSFKNNALFYIDYNDEEITGITFDDYNASDVIFMNTKHFNMLSNIHINRDNMLIVILDTNKHDENIKKEITEMNYLFERIDEMDLYYLYFINENKDNIANIILDYLNSDEEKRKEILEENS